MEKFDKKYLTRQADIIPIEALERTKITVIGAGGIGSHTVLSLARMGIQNITVWDFDEVSDVNMNNQGYSIPDIGMKKVEALAKKVKESMGIDINRVPERYEGQILEGIVIMAVDSMKVRKLIYDNNCCATYLIDGRMSAEVIDLYAYPAGSDVYKKSLFSDEEVPFVPCTEKATIYCSSLISGLIVKVVKDIITNKPYTKRVQWNLKENSFQCWLNK